MARVLISGMARVLISGMARDTNLWYGSFQDRTYDAPGPSYTVVTEETVDEVEKSQNV